MNILDIAKNVLKLEAEAITHLSEILNSDFLDAVETIYNSDGKVVVCGMGKSGNIGRKIASTLSSTGTLSVFINPAEGVHGDLGVIARNDVIIAISKSGETGELIQLLPFIKRIGAKIISITNNKNSTIANQSDINLIIDIDKEACPMNMAPTTSTTCTLALGDAIAVSLMKMRGFTEEDFSKFHPGGNIGKQLMKVSEVMQTDSLPIVTEDMPLIDVLQHSIEMKNRGVAIVVNVSQQLSGIFVEGDLKRLAVNSGKKVGEMLYKPIKDMMIRNPMTITEDKFVAEALRMFETNKITSLIVVNIDQKPIGLIHIHDILYAKVI